MTREEAMKATRGGLRENTLPEEQAWFLEVCRCQGDGLYCELYFLQSTFSDNTLCEACLDEAAYLRADERHSYLEERDHGPAESGTMIGRTVITAGRWSGARCAGLLANATSCWATTQNFPFAESAGRTTPSPRATPCRNLPRRRAGRFYSRCGWTRSESAFRKCYARTSPPASRRSSAASGWRTVSSCSRTATSAGLAKGTVLSTPGRVALLAATRAR